MALLRDVSSWFAGVWSSLPLVCGVVMLISLLAVPRGVPRRALRARTVMWQDEPATFFPRRTALVRVVLFGNLMPLGVWFAAMGISGGIEENWFWPVVSLVPAVYFLGFPVLHVLGRFRPGGTWITADRVVDEHFGLRTELRLRDVDTVIPRPDSVHLAPVTGVEVTHRALTPTWWRARRHDTDLVIRRDGEPAASRALADEVRGLVTRARR